MISIITSLYNSNKYLTAYIAHIEKASRTLTEAGVEHEFLIIANDPNSEESVQLEHINKNNNIRSRILICPRETLYTTWNRGIREALYPNITFWNVDDSRNVDAIIDGDEKIKEGFLVVYFPFLYKRYIPICGIRILVKRKIINPPEFNRELFLKGMYSGPFFMITKEAIEKVGGFDESFKIAGDFEWNVRAVRAGLRFKKSQKVAGIFTNDGTTLSGQKSDLHQAENKRICDTIL